MQNDLKLAQLLNMKLCHDLSGSLGVIDNCINMIDNQSQSIADQSKILIAEGTQNLVNSIKLYKFAFGPLDEQINQPAFLNQDQLKKMMTDFFVHEKEKFKFHHYAKDLSFDINLIKIVVCLGIIASENIHKSGLLSLYVHNNDSSIFKITSEGKYLVSQTDILNVLDGTSKASMDIKNCRQYYIYKLCNYLGYKISVRTNSDSIEFDLSEK